MTAVINGVMKMESTMTLRHQNTMLAVRREMGWPSFKPANDCIAFCSGRPMDFEIGNEMARIAQRIQKDLVYTGWTSTRAVEPTGFTIAYREMLTIDIVDRVVPHAANDEAPIVLVSTRADEFFAVDRRGSLVRVPGKPKNIGTGRRLAMKRIKATAATLGNEMLANNRFVPLGAEHIEPDEPTDVIVRFG